MIIPIEEPLTNLSPEAGESGELIVHSTSNHVRRATCANKSVIGIFYIQDFVPHVGEQKNIREIAIGTIVVTDIRTLNVNQLRHLISQQCHFKMDNSYLFLTSFGSPILLSQESTIEIKYLINPHNVIKFKRHLTPFRCSIIGFYSNNQGILLGYIYATYDNDLKLLRSKIEEILKDINANCAKSSTNFHFMHSSNYMIHHNNESNIVLIDIIHNNCIYINFDLNPSQWLEIQERSLSNTFKNLSNDDISLSTAINEDQSDLAIDKTKLSQKRSALTRRKVSKQKSMLKSSKKQIMISYVRREAAEHALNLKNTLIKCGFSVYLDVHEIQSGSDWQDSLNNAVQNCNFFVPLITQNYGRTQWTNREVKLADVLRKHIIPINFLDFWPPECLAIQFATTQYIPSKPATNDHNIEEIEEKDSDENIWDPESIEQVTKLIVEQIQKLSKKVKLKPTVSSYVAEGSEIPSEPNNTCQEKPLIVISAHPKQREISNFIKEVLSSDYQVWSSNDPPENLFSEQKLNEEIVPSSAYEQNLSPILEEHSTLTNATQDYARKIAENTKPRPKSVPNHEDSEFKVEFKKKDLVRVKSYNRESFYFSSITPDKMDKLKNFQEKVLLSSLVIIVASDQYYKSRTSEQHVYYCGQRKKTILVQCDKSPAPVWFSKLMSHDIALNYGCKDFKQYLIYKVKQLLDPDCKVMGNLHELKIIYLADCMKKNLPNLQTCVYVFGSTDLTNQRTIQICQEIGKELAQVSNINLVTNGFYGAGDLVAHTFVQELKNNPEQDKSVVHIVPIRDSENYSSKCRQNQDKTFEKASYGQTLFLGESIKERDSVIGRLLDTCILIEGDKHSAHEIEEFIWNDHYVIPVRSTGGAANGKFNVPEKIFSCPNGVRESDWQVMSKPEATPNEVAKAMVRIIIDLKNAIHEHNVSKNTTNLKKSFNEKPTKKRTAMRKRININVNSKNAVEEINQEQIKPSSPKRLPIFQENEMLSDKNMKKGFKGKINKFVKHIFN